MTRVTHGSALLALKTGGHDLTSGPLPEHHAIGAPPTRSDGAFKIPRCNKAKICRRHLRGRDSRLRALTVSPTVDFTAELTGNFARTGQGLQVDADRAGTALAVQRNEVSRSEEEIEVTIARLVQQLSLDPSTRVMPLEPTVVPFELIDRERTRQDLLALGLTNRPELGEDRALIERAIANLRREESGP